MPGHHLDDQALIFFGKEPSQERDELWGICLTPISVFMQ